MGTSRPSMKSAASGETVGAEDAAPKASSMVERNDSCITQLKAQGPSRTCNDSKEEQEEEEEEDEGAMAAEPPGAWCRHPFRNPASLESSPCENSRVGPWGFEVAADPWVIRRTFCVSQNRPAVENRKVN